MVRRAIRDKQRAVAPRFSRRNMASVYIRRLQFVASDVSRSGMVKNGWRLVVNPGWYSKLRTKHDSIQREKLAAK